MPKSISDWAIGMEDLKNKLRREGIIARESLSREERKSASIRIVKQILKSPEYKDAEIVMLYKAVRGEVRLDSLETDPSALGKRLVYPYCKNKADMEALEPAGKDSWRKGSFGIPEPLPEKSPEVSPDRIDLVICPCTVFDENCNRIGMGAGYYDRFLDKCVNAHIISVAFEVQKADDIPVDTWDKAMEKIYTETGVYPKI